MKTKNTTGVNSQAPANGLRAGSLKTVNTARIARRRVREDYLRHQRRFTGIQEHRDRSRE